MKLVKLNLFAGVFAMLVLNQGVAWAVTSEAKVLLDRTYSLRIYGQGRFSCGEPIPPNGHNFPVYTRLDFSQIKHDLWLSNVWTNVERYRADVGYEPCASFSRITNIPQGQELRAQVRQVITEKYQKNGFQVCMRATREEATLTVEGVVFRGVEEFLIGPVAQELCP